MSGVGHTPEAVAGLVESGYFVISSFRVSRAGEPPEPYVELKRKWYRWKWLANFAASPRFFVTQLGAGEYAFVLTEVVPAALAQGEPA